MTIDQAVSTLKTMLDRELLRTVRGLQDTIDRDMRAEALEIAIKALRNEHT